MNLSRQSTLSDQSYSVEMDDYYDNRWSSNRGDHDMGYRMGSHGRRSSMERQASFEQDSHRYSNDKDYDNTDIYYKQRGYYDNRQESISQQDDHKPNIGSYSEAKYESRYEYDLMSSKKQYDVQYEPHRMTNPAYSSDNRYIYLFFYFYFSFPVANLFCPINQFGHYRVHRFRLTKNMFNFDIKGPK